ncbi:cellulose biosynthesis cyclic di-GMP-binding regulatory protein BcsB [Paraburkholderia sp. LEh10]|uniref:cellulose biosynthesis cyclic di-GMP-binding regulatory protein BcsB n=1 Tax=Paraburkholderia sp. LEh10 TaxID=2821353 RepID=UPI001AE9101B|nr:cellulose biosynthesis cyclic di-GMP-binding regulatory protein BcsB [Paraburkholderia sp. LEh10]MBP0594373.1 cellulose biosynthesis cyclic di-GMP-binding regulatory protein BcsB [Paraburkholderia sp. LEh10]
MPRLARSRPNAWAALLLLATAAHAQQPADVAGSFAHLGSGRLATRTVVLTELGLHDPIVLRAPDSRQELYLPVPAGVTLSDAALQIDGGYLRGNGGRTTMLVSLDGSPVFSRSPAQEQGDGSATLGVDGAPRANGFVRVGLDWSSVVNDSVCADQTAIGNVWRIAPTTRFTYRYDPDSITDLRGAWSALPHKPVVMLGARTLGAPAFDAGWRLESLLQRDGRTPVTRAWPVAGDTVDLSGIDVPVPLRAIPAFAALAAGGSHTLANPAEAGALVALTPRPAFAPDLIVADDTLRNTLNTELDALREQVASAAPRAADAFDAWRARAIEPIAKPLAAGEVRLAHLGGQTAIVVGDKDAVAALARAWRPIDVTSRLIVHQIDDAPNTRGDGISLALLGGQPRTLDVQDVAVWDANFDLGAASGNGKLPKSVVLDVAAVPTANHAGQTASIYFNDVLIGSQLLNADGKPQRIEARVPHYTLAPNNLLRVVFRRQPEGGCQSRGQDHPVAVLPSSHLTLADATPGDDFTGMVARFATDANVIVPAAYLNDATRVLPRVASLANASGIAPQRASFSVARDGEAVSPKGVFLAADVTLADEKRVARLSKDRLSLVDASGRMLADVSGLNRVGVIEAVESGSVRGIVYRTVGDTAAILPASFQLSRGDIAIVDGSGTLRQFDTRHPGEVIDDDLGRPWYLRGWLAWGAAAGFVGLLVSLLLIAHIARRRSQDKS